ncbi:MAG: excinuclease ABC subunit UvrC [Bacteroidales bacterium]
MDASISEFIKGIPELPGVYQFFDSSDSLLYIGKAKNLKKRVAYYFIRVDKSNGKLRALVSKIKSIKYIVVDTESDALLLENILIKKNQPKYNILLKDDKTYPWICIKNEQYPRVFITRHYVDDGSLYFGPYTSGRLVKTLMDLIRGLFTLRTCNLNLTEPNIVQGKFKPCLEHQLGNCSAPCIGLQPEADYRNNIESIKNILHGNLSEVERWLVGEMKRAAENYQFEKAHSLKTKVETLQKYQSKTTIINPKYKDIEVYTINEKDKVIVVNYLNVNSGVIIQSYNIEIKNQLDEKLSELLALAIVEIRERVKSNTKNVLVNLMPEFLIKSLNYSVPYRGEKKQLVDLSLRNGVAYTEEILQRDEVKNPQQRAERILNQVKADLHLSDLPVHIECFDNSNFQGSNPVASCVVFKNAKPSKRDYRHFIIKSVSGPNDFASMQEVVYRRYKRLLDEQQPIPQLVIIDGGKGQLSAAMNSLKALKLENRIQLVGIAKRLEEIYFPGDSIPLYLDKRSESLKVIQQLRDEAHRFGVRLHSNRRSKSAMKSSLDGILGIGPKTAELLLLHLKSVENIINSDTDTLSKIVGRKKAEILMKHFHKI